MTCVIVLGLPRSGTSALAGVLHQLGVNMGDLLMPPMAGVNEKGFFEDEEFVAIHIKLLGSHIDPQIGFDVPNPPSSADLDLYGRIIASREHQEWWGVKDPKLCFLLPYFLPRLKPTTKVRILVTERAFHESVESMKPLYGGMSTERAATLLGRYLYCRDRFLAELEKRRIGDDERRLDIMRVDFDQLIDGYITPHFIGDGAFTREFLVERICGFLDMPNGEKESAAAAKWLEPRLRHHGNKCK